MSIKSIIREWLGVDDVNSRVDGLVRQANQHTIEVRQAIIDCVDDLVNRRNRPANDQNGWAWGHTQDNFNNSIKRLTEPHIKTVASEEARRVATEAMKAINAEDFIDTVVDRINRKRLISV